jgi:hypothetical protein
MAELVKIILSIVISSIIYFVVTLIVYVTRRDRDIVNESLKTRDPKMINIAQ